MGPGNKLQPFMTLFNFKIWIFSFTGHCYKIIVKLVIVLKVLIFTKSDSRGAAEDSHDTISLFQN